VPSRIEDYALLGDLFTAALVARDGSIDWLCLPRFDSDACFAALLGTPENGRWQIAPAHDVGKIERRYREGTLILETTFTTDTGAVTLIDFMPVHVKHPVLVRIVEGKRGQVPMHTELVIRFDYGSVVPWMRRADGVLRAVAGPNRLEFRTPVDLRGENLKTVADFTVSEGERVPFVMSWWRSYKPSLPPLDPEAALRDTEQWWCDWAGGCQWRGEWAEAILRSLVTLKGLTYAPTGGVVAAATTSLPEQLGGVRNWDYRFCWLRDATFTLMALMEAGFEDEARDWREWLLRAVAGKPSETQILYGIRGERRLPELELDWLPGYEGARPVRIGNAASHQFQLDVYGEVLDAMYQCRCHGMEPDPFAWKLETALVEFLESAWQKPDEGIWEVRGPRRHFTHSKVMAWVAFDRAAKAIRRFGLDGPAEHWEKLADAVHEQVCQQGYNPEVGAFVQYYGARELDASLLMIPLVGFLKPDDPRMRSTVDAIERNLTQDGFVARYPTHTGVDGLPPGEGAFLPCTFWLADNYVLLGRGDEAKRVFERLLELRNDVGLLAEEYDPHAGRQVGNFPQAFSHIGLVNTAHNLAKSHGPAAKRAKRGEHRW
jgi:GH15 family glucan-1,4-alpha-glucosidase